MSNPQGLKQMKPAAHGYRIQLLWNRELLQIEHISMNMLFFVVLTWICHRKEHINYWTDPFFEEVGKGYSWQV